MTTTEVLLSLDPSPEAGRVARHALSDRGLSDDMDHTLMLLTSEVVGNAVRHAPADSGDRIVFFARLSDDHAHVEVADPGDGFDPEVRYSATGYGLRLVDKLASDWGVERTGRGCRVWFDVDRRKRFVTKRPPRR